MADFDWVHLIHADQWLELSLAGDIMLYPQVTPHCEPLKPFEGVVLKDPIPLRFFTVIETCVCVNMFINFNHRGFRKVICWVY